MGARASKIASTNERKKLSETKGFRKLEEDEYEGAGISMVGDSTLPSFEEDEFTPHEHKEPEKRLMVEQARKTKSDKKILEHSR